MLIDPNIRLIPDILDNESEPNSESALYSTDMDKYQIPRFLQESYLIGRPPPAFDHLRNWQCDLLGSEEWKSGRNCVVHVPTAGGKTLVAEVAIAQLLNEDKNAKALYCVPFVSLAVEKHAEFCARFPTFSVRGFYQNVGPSAFVNGNIAVCTYERAHSVINAALKMQTLGQIKLIVIDEMHMIGDDSRGSTIEAFICKAMLTEYKPRIIGLSATMSEIDTKNFANWIGGFAFENRTRPSRIKQFVKKVDGTLCQLSNGEVGNPFLQLVSIKGDNRHIVPLVANTLRRPGNTVLLFVNTRHEAVNTALLLAANLYSYFFNLKPCSNDMNEKRQELMNYFMRNHNDQMVNCIQSGIAFHHAGLTLEEREIIEKAFRKGIINVIVATTTLSAGINFLNISLVVVCDVMRGIGDSTTMLHPITYMQMAGRAGRTKEKQGSVVLIQRTSAKKELDVICSLSKNEIPQLDTFLLRNQDFDRFYIQCLCFIGAQNGADKFAEMSYKAKVKHAEWGKIINQSVERLKKLGLYEPPKVSILGYAIASANLPIEDGIELNSIIRKNINSDILHDPLFIMFICTSPSTDIRTPSYKNNIWERFVSENEKIIMEISGIDKNMFQRRVIREITLGKKDEDKTDKILDRLLIASVLVDFIDEKSLTDLENKYKMERGTIENLQNSAEVFSGQVAKFCEVASFIKVASIITIFRKRLEYGVKQDLLQLMQLSSCTPRVARTLMDKGIGNAYDIILLTVDQLSTMIAGIEPTSCIKIAKNLLLESEKIYEVEMEMAKLEEINM